MPNSNMCWHTAVRLARWYAPVAVIAALFAAGQRANSFPLRVVDPNFGFEFTKSINFQESEEEFKRRKAEQEAKALLNRAKRYVEEKSDGLAYAVLVELHDKHPFSPSDDEGQKIIVDVKVKVNKHAAEMLAEAEASIKSKDFVAGEKQLKQLVESCPLSSSTAKAEKLLKETQKINKDEKDAADALKLIRKFKDDSTKVELFRRQAEAIAKKYPSTKTAVEIRVMLKNLD